MAPAATLLISLLALLPTTLAAADSSDNSIKATATKACHQISSSVSHSSAVFWPGSAEYKLAISHWSNSSTEIAVCAVEPGTVKDVSTIVKILGSTRAPFGVKGGGHIANVGFSSSKGVQIAMSRFNTVKYDKASSTVQVGAGLVWDDVYSVLEPEGVMALGGRLSGLGVAGFATGGGYSWKTNQHGLTIDTVAEYDLILPNGTAVTASDASHPDLFFAMKGSYNNWGIITGFKFHVFPQTQVFGGNLIYTADKFDVISKATSKFSETNTDPRATLITIFLYDHGVPLVNVLLFYDGPTVPNGLFDDFLAVEAQSKDVSTRGYLSLVKALTVGDHGYNRSAFHTVMLLNYTDNIMNVIINETNFWAEKLQPLSATFIAYGAEPFHGASDHATPSAFTHDTPLSPFNINFAWTDARHDKDMFDAFKASALQIYNAAVAEGQDIKIEEGKQILYPNYCLGDTPLEAMYGKNLPKLRQLHKKIDPKNTMGLTGGFKF